MVAHTFQSLTPFYWSLCPLVNPHFTGTCATGWPQKPLFYKTLCHVTTKNVKFSFSNHQKAPILLVPVPQKMVKTRATYWPASKALLQVKREILHCIMLQYMVTIMWSRWCLKGMIEWTDAGNGGFLSIFRPEMRQKKSDGHQIRHGEGKHCWGRSRK